MGCVYIAQILFTGPLINQNPWSILPPTAESFTKGAFRTYCMPDKSFDAVKCLFETHLTLKEHKIKHDYVVISKQYKYYNQQLKEHMDDLLCKCSQLL